VPCGYRVFWLRLDHLIKPCFLPASLLLSLYIMLTFTHVTSRSLRTPTPLLTSCITCAPSHAHAHYRRMPSCASHALLTSLFSLHAPCLPISLCAVRNNASHRVIWHFSLGNTWHELAAPLWVLSAAIPI